MGGVAPLVSAETCLVSAVVSYGLLWSFDPGNGAIYDICYVAHSTFLRSQT